jgi:hypothetical protein
MKAAHHSWTPLLHFLVRLTLPGIGMIAALSCRKVQALLIVGPFQVVARPGTLDVALRLWGLRRVLRAFRTFVVFGLPGWPGSLRLALRGSLRPC